MIRWLRYLALVPALPLILISCALSGIAVVLNEVAWIFIDIAEPDEERT